MAAEIYMPRLGWGMEEGIFGEWLKQDGDAVQAGEHLFTVEGDKATEEIESFDSGVLHIPPTAPKPGDTVTVGALVGYILQPGEAAPQVAQPSLVTPQTSNVEREPSSVKRESSTVESPSSTVHRPSSTVAISPRARRVAKELDIDWATLTGSGSTGRIIERDIRAAASQRIATAKVRVTPVAQRLAQEAGLDLAELARQKAGERIDRADVEAALAGEQKSAVATSDPAEYEIVPVSRMRSVIAKRMSESVQTAASVTLTSDADASEFVALRESFKAAFAPRNLPVPSYNDLLIKLTGVALQQHPLLAATWHGHEIHVAKALHIGLAVETTDGLLVPTVRNVPTKSLRQITHETTDLVERALQGQLRAEELQGGVFTITNLGRYNIDAFTPIINLPQSAILGVGRIAKKPAVVNDQIVPRWQVTLSLTFDHRVVDGAPAARFLNTIRELIETPALWLAG